MNIKVAAFTVGEKSYNTSAYINEHWDQNLMHHVHPFYSENRLIVTFANSKASDHAPIQRGGGGGGQGVKTPPSPLKNHKHIGFLSNNSYNPLKKITKLPSQYSMLGHHRHASETRFKWRFTGGHKMARS